MADIAGEAELGKAYDARLVRRLWTYVRPYKAIFWGAVLLSPVSQTLSLVQPYLLKLGIDGYVMRGDVEGLRTLALLFAGAIVGEFVSQYWQQYLTTMVPISTMCSARCRPPSHSMTAIESVLTASTSEKSAASSRFER